MDHTGTGGRPGLAQRGAPDTKCSRTLGRHPGAVPAGPLNARQATLARSIAPPRTSTAWSWALVGAGIGLLAAVILFAPARWLANAVAQRSDGRIVLAD